MLAAMTNSSSRLSYLLSCAREAKSKGLVSARAVGVVSDSRFGAGFQDDRKMYY